MTQEDWYSTNIRFICLIENKGAHRYANAVYLFRSTDFDKAFDRALEIGRSKETSYLNSDGHKVVWKLKEIISLDIIQADSLDGAEIYYEPSDIPVEDSFPFDAEFHPENSKPAQTI